MTILNIIDKIYENEYFATALVVAIIVLIVLFAIVLFLGIKDAKKAKEPPKEVEEDVKDITFNMPTEQDKVKEDVTFEMPILTKNLENFKKNLEEEIQKEDSVEIRKTSGLVLKEEEKPVKILDMGEIEDTAILPIIKSDKIDKKNIDNVELEAVKEKNNNLEYIDDGF